MISEDGEFIRCDGDPDCKAKIKNHYWGKVKAVGWVFRRQLNAPDKAYCPEHTPAWWAEWQAKRKKN